MFELMSHSKVQNARVSLEIHMAHLNSATFLTDLAFGKAILSVIVKKALALELKLRR